MKKHQAIADLWEDGFLVPPVMNRRWKDNADAFSQCKKSLVRRASNRGRHFSVIKDDR